MKCTSTGACCKYFLYVCLHVLKCVMSLGYSVAHVQYVAQVGEKCKAGRLFVLRYFADSRYMRKLPVVMIIVIYPVEVERKGIADKYKVMKMYGGVKVLVCIFKRYGGGGGEGEEY